MFVSNVSYKTIKKILTLAYKHHYLKGARKLGKRIQQVLARNQDRVQRYQRVRYWCRGVKLELD